MRASVMSVAAVTATILLSSGAEAQAPSAPLLSSPGPKACPPDVANPPLTSNPTTHPLSEQLSESKGVICPPAGIDPGLAEKPPPTRDNPVIPPPGAPGGNPTVIPK